MDYKFRKMNQDEFNTVFTILKDSFPADEYRDYDGQHQLLKNDRYTVYVLADSNEIKAFITVWEFDDLIFIEHLAVCEKYRNQGAGTSVLKLICSMTDKDICLEVELPETEKAERRIAFYKRNGFVINDYGYEQPAYSEDKNAVPLLIMTYKKAISPERFKEIRKELYLHVYKKDGS